MSKDTHEPCKRRRRETHNKDYLMKKPYYLHWCYADPFSRVIILVVGDYRQSFKEINRKFKPSNPSITKPFCDGLAEMLDDDLIYTDPSQAGRTIEKKDGDVFIWFPAFPKPGILAHELLHAVNFVLHAAGVEDRNGETDAYLLDRLFDHFFSVLEKDKKNKQKKEKQK